MKKKLGIILAIIIILSIIVILWISGIIPKQIARISAINYLKKNCPKMHLEYVDTKWDYIFGGYRVYFKDENNKNHGILMDNKYFPILPGQGIVAFEENYREKYENQYIENENENKKAQVEFVRTYNIVSNLNKTDATGENNFYVVQQFQLFEPIVIKVNKKYVLQENKNYEFTFKGSKIDGKDYTIQDIFITFDITNIEKTDKVGLEQRQDAI